MPVRFEIEVKLDGVTYEYIIAFELPEGFREMRVAEEKFSVGAKPVYSRKGAQVTLAKSARGQEKEAKFLIDWHLVALPVVQEQSPKDPLALFKRWLAHLLVLRPLPSLIRGESNEKTLQPSIDLSNFAAWFTGLMTNDPPAYSKLEGYLKQLIPDLKSIKNPEVAKDAHSLEVQFSTPQGNLSLAFEDLSDGEKCFLICAMVLVANESYGPLFCFWDEPDNYLALSEVGHFIVALRKSFTDKSQLLITSHNPEAISRFSDENTFYLSRRSHLEPTVVQILSKMKLTEDITGLLISGEL